jgi:two-component system OmpR family response regulator/two-component system alkaline phosphatase synthesis response regulator PhoP
VEASAPHVLVVEDEPHIQELVSLHLALEGFDCIPASDGPTAVKIAAERPLDLVVLDLMIPGLDGVTVCKTIRRQVLNGDVPILILTARREESEKVLGLESGADDYLTKPFGVRELVARARALLRRPRGGAGRAGPPGALQASTSPGLSGGPPDLPHARPLAVHGIEVDPARRRVRVGGREVDLTKQEFDLLHLLAAHPGIVFSREALLSRIWKEETFVTTRSVDTLVKRLRRKIEIDSHDPRLILTVWGAGYRFADV